MRMGEAFKTCMRKYADFSGRARRSEYWWYVLVLNLISLPFNIFFFVGYIAFFVSLAAESTPSGDVNASDLPWATLVVPFVLVMIVSLAFLLPSYAAQVRRLHDMGQSGMWVLLNLAGLGIVATVMCIMDTQPGANQWGPDPKAGERVAYGYPPAAHAYPPSAPTYPPSAPPGA
jgi:uncharacterized membrane protein YhaH (DUF805 family)